MLNIKELNRDLQEEIGEVLFEHFCYNSPKPKAKSRHIGIELECFSPKNPLELYSWLADSKALKGRVILGDDGTIKPKRGTRSYEVRLLTTESKYKKDLKELNKFLKENKFGVNKSCGFHVHLDCRKRDWKKVVKRLLVVQPIMKRLVNKGRLQNHFCSPLLQHWQYFPENDNLGYYSYKPPKRTDINGYMSYKKRKTVEVRLHHGTVDVGQMENWITLLVKVAGFRAIPKSKEDAVKKIQPRGTFKKYIEKAA